MFLTPLLHTPVIPMQEKGTPHPFCWITPTRHIQGKQGVCADKLPQEVCFCYVLDKVSLITTQQKQPQTVRAGIEEGENVHTGKASGL